MSTANGNGHGNGKSGSATKLNLITGGAGFVGTNVAHRLLSQGERVLVLDNLSRRGVDRNLAWLQAQHGSAVQVEVADIRDRDAVRRAVAGVDRVFHFAAQVAVTTSLTHPLDDFGVNLEGTVTLLEELRALPEAPPLLFTSTNKVYGALPDLSLAEGASRYEPIDPVIRTNGVSEDRPLSFCSPYGCSKGAADQYVIDYAKSYGLPTVVFRMSCIYGPHQQGNEDQGWVAHFLLRALDGEPLTIYGDGKQVRDVLFVEDLVDAMLLATDHIDAVRGQAFNVGGGPASTTSLLELLDLIEELQGSRPDVDFGDWRTGDQPYYVSDTRRLEAALGWRARVGVQEGVERLHRWLVDSRRPLQAAAR